MLKIALLTLTLDGGAVHMAMTEAESPEECKGKAEVVEQVLIGAGYTVVAMRCGQTDLNLTPYNHGAGDRDMKWHYHVTVNGTALEDGFNARLVEPGTCTAEGDDEYCAASAQGPVAE